MKSVNPNLVFRQLLSNLPDSILACPLMNGTNKITDFSIVKLFIMANVAQWNSHRDIEAGIQSDEALKKELGIDFISYSTISRRLNGLDTEHLVDLFNRIARRYWQVKGVAKGINSNVGVLKIIDATYGKLPKNALNWTAVSKDSCGIKLHIRVALASANSVYPEKMIPSTGNIADSDAVNHIIDADGALYVMDRGYAHKTKMGGWMERGVQFLVRTRKNFRMETLKSETPTHDKVLRNELVSILTREEPLRYIEFVDDKGTHFHLVTNRLDLTEEEIMETYKNRWYIELFFKWLKQHVKIDHLFSTSPVGIWNQMYIALITVALAEILRLIHMPNRTLWTLFRNVRLYVFKTIRKLLNYVNRKLRKSKGRQKVSKEEEKPINYGEDSAIVDPINKQHFIKKEKKLKATKKNKAK